MKRIISLLLAVCSVFVLFSCRKATGGASGAGGVGAMLSSNAPSRIEVTTTQTLGANDVVITSKSTLVTGKYNGKVATIYTYEDEELASVADGATEVVTPMIKKTEGKKEYLEDKGVRVDGGKWDEDGEDFAPALGSLTLNVSSKNVNSVTDKNGVYTCVVPAANTKAVFGEAYDIAYDVSLEVHYYEGFVNKIVMLYTVPEITKDDLDTNEDLDKDMVGYPEVNFRIEVKYEYGKQSVTIE